MIKKAFKETASSDLYVPLKFVVENGIGVAVSSINNQNKTSNKVMLMSIIKAMLIIKSSFIMSSNGDYINVAKITNMVTMQQ